MKEVFSRRRQRYLILGHQDLGEMDLWPGDIVLAAGSFHVLGVVDEAGLFRWLS